MIEVAAPLEGLVCPLGDVPDPVFSQAMVGPGVALRPSGPQVVARAPMRGRVASLHPHAYAVASESGVAVLVHLGIDTVKLEGQGFEVHVAKDDDVAAGQPIVTWTPSEVEARGFSAMCPVVALDTPAEALGDLREDGLAAAGELLFSVHM